MPRGSTHPQGWASTHPWGAALAPLDTELVGVFLQRGGWQGGTEGPWRPELLLPWHHDNTGDPPAFQVDPSRKPRPLGTSVAAVLACWTSPVFTFTKFCFLQQWGKKASGRQSRQDVL